MFDYIKFSFTFFKDKIYGVIFLLFFALLSNLIKIITPLFLSYFIDRIVIKNLLDLIVPFSLIFIAIILIGVGLSFFSNYLLFKIINSHGGKLKSDIYNFYLQSSNRKFGDKEDRQVGNLVYSLLNDAERVSSSWYGLFGYVPIQILLLIAIIVFFPAVPQFVLLNTVFVIILLVVTIFWYKYKERDTESIKNENQNFINSVVDVFQNIEVVNSYHAEKFEADKFDRSIKKYFSENKKIYQINKFIEQVTYLIISIWTISALIIGAYLIMENNLSIGQLISYIFMMNLSLSPLNLIIGFFMTFNNVKKSYDNLKIVTIVTIGNTSVSNFCEHSLEKIQIKDFTCKRNNTVLFGVKKIELKIGKPYIICGKNGSGKTTVSKIIAGLYGDHNDSIKAFDKSENEVSLSNILFVSSKNYVFNNTLKYNLVYPGLIGNDEELINTLCKYRFKSAFIDYYYNDNFIGVNGANISNGERQKISLIRALHSKYEAIIFDEPTVHLDAITKEVFILEISEICKNKLIIINTNSPEDFFGIKFEIRNGELVEYNFENN